MKDRETAAAAAGYLFFAHGYSFRTDRSRCAGGPLCILPRVYAYWCMNRGWGDGEKHAKGLIHHGEFIRASSDDEEISEEFSDARSRYVYQDLLGSGK